MTGTSLIVNEPAEQPTAPRRLAAADHRTAVAVLLDWLETQPIFASVKAVGHRVVHGMKHSEPERVTSTLLKRLRFLPPYSPDFNPIELAFAKLKAFMRAARPRSFDQFCELVATALGLYTPTECANYVRHSGYRIATRL